MNADAGLHRRVPREQNFRGANLRGQSFKGKTLSGINFSQADIRGANFSDAILKGANFTGAKAGLQRRWVVIRLLIALPLSILLHFVSAIFNAVFVTYFFSSDIVHQVSVFPGIFLLLLIAAIFLAIIRQGLTFRALVTIAIAVSGAVAIAVIGAGPRAVAIAGAVAGAGAGAVAVAVLVAIAGAVAVAGAGAGATAGSILGAVAVTIAVAVAVAEAVAVVGAGAGAIAIVVAVAVAGALLSGYVAWRALAGEEKFALVRRTAVAFGAMGGTSFAGADLTGANFSGASLKSTNFAHSRIQPTNLTRVCWTDAKKLDRARVGDSILSNPAVRQLLTSRNGYNRSYVGMNLEGANLQGVNLNQASLTRANLSNATLERAELRDANLRQVSAVGANFTRAHLTGACLEAWNIDRTTVLTDVDCQFVFLLEEPNQRGDRERRPHNPNKDFQPGDFEKFFKEVLNTVQILIRQGAKLEDFQVAFQTIMRENDITLNDIKKIEKKDEDVLIEIQVPDGTDKGRVEQAFDAAIEVRIAAARTAGLLEGETRRAESLEKAHLATVSKIGNLLSHLNIDVTAMSHSNNANISASQGSFVNTGSMSGNLVNLGEISGTAANTIHQLQNVDRPETSQLADLLQRLQAAIAADSTLHPDDKTEALEQVNMLAQAAQDPQDGTLKKLANTAVKLIKGTVTALPATAALAQACQELLPVITQLLGLP